MNCGENGRLASVSMQQEKFEPDGTIHCQLARGLRRDCTNMTGMIIPEITNPFFPALVRAAEDAA